ncbi:MAG: hydantoinase/oxoprolinase family protein [Thermoleophilia bacterium]|nr:hydantoinase/oxoprolinase family protein [Thermoleophilia bacterium]
MKRAGVDVGGTFTDLVLIDDDTGSVFLNKVPTTTEDPSIGTMNGVREMCAQAGISPKEIGLFFHGTTIATNIIIEHNGAKTGMITTKGYRDIIYIARHKRPYNFSLQQDLPWQKHALVKRRHRLPVNERVIAPDGTVLVPLDEDEVRQAARKLRAAGVEAVALCFMFSFLNPAHEQRAKEIILEEFPEAYLSVSHEVIPQYREYYRFTTTCLNSYIGPKVSRYVRNLGSAIRQEGMASELHLMQSAGGVTTMAGAIDKPVNLLMSGPIAGLIGGIWAGGLAGYDSVITLDVGGTSADIGVAPGGQMRVKHLLDTKIGDYDAMIPMVDIDTIGAGGGSVAFVDEGGIFNVGPRSAGSYPGPACYSRGGTEPTSTDANVALGRLNPDWFLGGKMTLDPALSRKAIEEHICGPLSLDLEQAALGIIRILNQSMVHSIELNSVRKGFDPRDFALVAFGGAGPMHACEVAEELSIPTVIVPPNPGNTSAVGLLATDLKYDFSRTELTLTSNPNLQKLNADFAEVEAEARERLGKDGMTGDEVLIRRLADCRYVGQGYELRVPVASGEVDQENVASLSESFHSIHENEYKRRFDGWDIEIVNIRVEAVGKIRGVQWQTLGRAGIEPDAQALNSKRPVTFLLDGQVKQMETAHWAREALRAGNVISGPAVIEQVDSTTLIPPHLSGWVDDYGNIIIEIGRKGA